LGPPDIKRPGRDITLIGYGRGLVESLEAAALLEQDGVDAEVLGSADPGSFGCGGHAGVGVADPAAVVVHDAVRFAGRERR